MKLSEVYTLAEAAERYNKSQEYLRQRVSSGSLDTWVERGLIRKSSADGGRGTWLITKQAMDEIFGEVEKPVSNKKPTPRSELKDVSERKKKKKTRRTEKVTSTKNKTTHVSKSKDGFMGAFKFN